MAKRTKPVSKKDLRLYGDMDRLARLQCLEGAAGVGLGKWTGLGIKAGFQEAKRYFGNLSPNWYELDPRLTILRYALREAKKGMRQNESDVSAWDIVQSAFASTIARTGAATYPKFYKIGTSVSKDEISKGRSALVLLGSLVSRYFFHTGINVRRARERDATRLEDYTEPEAKSPLFVALQSPDNKAAKALRKRISELAKIHCKDKDREIFLRWWKAVAGLGSAWGVQKENGPRIRHNRFRGKQRNLRRMQILDADWKKKDKELARVFSWIMEVGTETKTGTKFCFQVRHQTKKPQAFEGNMEKATPKMSKDRTVKSDEEISQQIQRIQEVVARHFHLSVDQLKGNTRRDKIARPRMMAMYLSRRFVRASYPKIGQCFGKDHSTVMHACRRVIKDPSFQSTLTPLLKDLPEWALEASEVKGNER